MKGFRLLLGLGLASAGMIGGACDSGVANTTTEPDPTLASETLAMSFFTQDTTTACGEAAGIRVTVAMGEQEKTCDAVWAVLASVPYTGEVDNGVHFLADCFFLVEPGMWTVESIEVIGLDGAVLECCEAEFQPEVAVVEGETSEFGAELTCDVVGPGALDIYGWLNRPPILKDIDIYPSKFGYPCMPRYLQVAAEDMEGDNFTFEWEVLEAPGTKYALWEHDYWAVFVGFSPGTYQLKVTVRDEHGAATSLQFPIHVVVPYGYATQTDLPECVLDHEPPPPEGQQ